MNKTQYFVYGIAFGATFVSMIIDKYDMLINIILFIIPLFFSIILYKKQVKDSNVEFGEIRNLLRANILVSKDPEIMTPVFDSENKLQTIEAEMSASLKGNSSFKADINSSDKSVENSIH